MRVVTVMIFALCALLIARTPAIASDLDHDMRYNLPVGMAYTYRITTDHFPFAGKGVRLHTKLVLEIMGRDGEDYTHCRVHMIADTVFDREKDITYMALGHIEFAGHRLYSKGGYLNTMFDSRGRLDEDVPKRDSSKYTKQVVTQFTDFNSVQAAVSGNSPFLMQLLIPSLPNAESVEINKFYFDTVAVPSRAVSVPTSYGVSGKVEQHVLYDTVYRAFVLDSVVHTDKEYTGYVTVKTERFNVVGTRFRTEARLIRNMNTGLVNSYNELCYKITPSKEKIWYISRASLIETTPITAADPTGPGPGMPSLR
jgi:hypothetical protein